jgi:hypothetical protein
VLAQQAQKLLCNRWQAQPGEETQAEEALSTGWCNSDHARLASGNSKQACQCQTARKPESAENHN